MSEFDFEIEPLRFSYSSLSTFNTCAYAFKLTYIDVEERIGNFFADFGSLIHLTMEHYWNGDIPKEELANYFMEVYDDAIQNDPPPFPPNMEANYYNDALNFLKEFPYDRDDYDVIEIEGTYKFLYGDIKFTIRPDLILCHKETGQIQLVDFKTSKPVKGKKQTWDEKKLEDYKKQTIIYAYFYEQETGRHIDKIKLLFPRLMKEYVFSPSEEDVTKVLDWLKTTVQLIRWENEFEPTIDPYFCNNICSVRQACKYKQTLFRPTNFYTYDFDED